MSRVAVAGASGYVGRRLVARLVTEGHEVVALGRRADALPDGEGVERRATDVGDADEARAAFTGCDAVYWLVHSMGGGTGFRERDRQLAASAAAAAAEVGVGRIVYLGGLGGADDDGELSEHLASRHEVGAALAATAVPVVELRAAVVLGAGSISFEMLRYLTERLPVMVCPRWIGTRVQPVAERDLLDVLVAALDAPGGVYEIGGPDVTTYREMIDVYARVRGLRRRTIVDVPVLTPGLSARWVDLVTPVDRAISHALIDSLTAEVVVRDPGPAAAAFPGERLGLEDALRAALDDQASAMPAQLFDQPEGIADGVSTMHSTAVVAPSDVHAARRELAAAGGDLDWYGVPTMWRLRLVLGRLLGERLRLRRPDVLEPGAEVDWWTAEVVEPDRLVLGTRAWFCGEAWLGYRIVDTDTDGGVGIEQAGSLRAKGVPGLVYWRLLWPIHAVVFRRMAARRAQRVRRRRGARSLGRAGVRTLPVPVRPTPRR